jgi:hypothetical protein
MCKVDVLFHVMTGVNRSARWPTPHDRSLAHHLQPHEPGRHAILGIPLPGSFLAGRQELLWRSRLKVRSIAESDGWIEADERHILGIPSFVDFADSLTMIVGVEDLIRVEEPMACHGQSLISMAVRSSNPADVAGETIAPFTDDLIGHDSSRTPGVMVPSVAR